MTSGAARQQSSLSRYTSRQLWGGHIYFLIDSQTASRRTQHMETLPTIGNFDMTSQSSQAIKAVLQ